MLTAIPFVRPTLCRWLALLALGLPCAGLARTTPTVRTGAEKLALHDFRSAEQDFRAVLNQEGVEARDRAEARYGLALCLWHRTPSSPELNREARDLFTVLVREAPQDPLAPLAQRSLARLLEARDYPGDVPDLPAARAAYQEVMERWPDHPAAAQAGLQLIGTYFRDPADQEQARQGQRLLREWLAAHQGHDLEAVGWEYLGSVSEMILREPGEALAAYLKAEALGFVVPSRSGVTRWRMARLAEETAQWPLAAECYRKVILLHPRGGRAHDAFKALQRLRADHPDLAFEIPPLPWPTEDAP